MLLLPIVDRELRAAARSWRTYLGRVITCLAAIGMALYLIWFVRLAMPGPMGGIFILKATSFMAWAVCVFAGITRTCDSISSEKREDTLGLLFLTHLKGYDVVLGKLLASSLAAFFAMIGLIPVFSVPVLMGGVSGVELVRIPVVLLNSLFLAASAGLFVSSLSRSQRAASSVAGGTFVFLAVILPALAQIVEHEFHWSELARMLRLPSPLCTMEMAFSTAIGLTTNDFWKSTLIQFFLGLGTLFGACKITPRAWQNRNISLAGWAETFHRWRHGTSDQRKQRRTRLLRINPFFWLSHRDRFAVIWPFVFLTTTFGVVLWITLYYEIPRQPAFGLLLAVIAVNDLVMRMRVASIAASRLGEDRQSGGLELILSTPMALGVIISGLWRAIRHIQLPAYCALFFLYAFVSSVFFHEMEGDGDSALVIILFALVSIGDFVVLGYVAMWKGMRIANPRYAAGSAMVRVLILPWFLFLGLIPFVHEIDALRRAFDAGEPYSYLLSGLAIWTLSSVTAWRSARRNLRDHFREAATDRYLFERKFSMGERFRHLKLRAARFTQSDAV